MKAFFSFVPPGGGEQEFALMFDVPAIPQPGDFITIHMDGKAGTSDFIVRRIWWQLKHVSDDTITSIDKPTIGYTSQVVVECEFVIGPFSSDGHREICQNYRLEGYPLKDT